MEQTSGPEGREIEEGVLLLEGRELINGSDSDDRYSCRRSSRGTPQIFRSSAMSDSLTSPSSFRTDYFSAVDAFRPFSSAA